MPEPGWQAPVALTTVPEALAEVGFRFAYMGDGGRAECPGCPVPQLCFALKPGRVYRVTSVRGVTHPCTLHDGGARVVEAQEVPFTTTLETARTRGTAATWRPVPCGYPECAKYALCHPVGPPSGARYEIVQEGPKVACPMRYDIRAVRLRQLDG